MLDPGRYQVSGITDCKMPGWGRARRHIRLELSIRQGVLERPLLSEDAFETSRNRSIRRAAFLRGALQYGRGEHDLLWPAAARRDTSLGGTDAAWIRFLAEA